ncbi:hypothetical protein L6452_43459 [Arctium lappa]|uniref:Uncharacterized protein n=1 Tax=Arctium lappa TaxID=4217 RepID=A0ACB8XD05_ARCLA|nr:hypothetical protein L6452_43459 [Arctium lappa]
MASMTGGRSGMVITPTIAIEDEVAKFTSDGGKGRTSMFKSFSSSENKEKASKCIKAAIAKKNKSNEKRMEKDAEGFTCVEKKQWRPKPKKPTQESDASTSKGTSKSLKNSEAQQIHTVVMESEKGSGQGKGVDGSNDKGEGIQVDPTKRPTEVDKGVHRKDGDWGTTTQKSDRPSLVLNSVLSSLKAIKKPIRVTYTQTSNRIDVLSDDPAETQKQDQTVQVEKASQNTTREDRGISLSSNND